MKAVGFSQLRTRPRKPAPEAGLSEMPGAYAVFRAPISETKRQEGHRDGVEASLGWDRQSVPWLLGQQLARMWVPSGLGSDICVPESSPLDSSLETDCEKLGCYSVLTGGIWRKEPERPGQTVSLKS